MRRPARASPKSALPRMATGLREGKVQCKRDLSSALPLQRVRVCRSPHIAASAMLLQLGMPGVFQTFKAFSCFSFTCPTALKGRRNWGTGLVSSKKREPPSKDSSARELFSPRSIIEVG